MMVLLILELQADVSQLLWVLRSELRSFGRGKSTLDS